MSYNSKDLGLRLTNWKADVSPLYFAYISCIQYLIDSQPLFVFRLRKYKSHFYSKNHFEFL